MLNGVLPLIGMQGRYGRPEMEDARAGMGRCPNRRPSVLERPPLPSPTGLRVGLRKGGGVWGPKKDGGVLRPTTTFLPPEGDSCFTWSLSGSRIGMRWRFIGGCGIAGGR